MILPILLFSARGNYEWKDTSSSCISHKGELLLLSRQRFNYWCGNKK